MSEEKRKRVDVRLSEKADYLLRAAGWRKGDLSQGLRKAILDTDWDRVEVLKRRRTSQRFLRTGFSIDPEVYEKLKECAKTRGVEVSGLIDAIIISYYSQSRNNL